GKSRYVEEKRVVFHKNVGPLISMEEMSRCIHCTRCVRFGQEVAGVMELGMPHRGEHSEISTFVGRTVDSEVSGNMIDLCPVGALTSKPFRYSARTWELSRRKSVSPHDSCGANLVVQVKNGKVLRVVPLENEAVNECWISDRDRFSYEALNADTRLTRPMVKQDGHWQLTDWPTALNHVAKGLKSIRHQHGPASLAGLVAPTATLEEGGLLAMLLRALGSENIDAALRQQDDRLRAAPLLGRPLASLSHLDAAFVIGSQLRHDHPLLALRLRASARHGAQISRLHAVADDWAMPIAQSLTAAPSRWLEQLAGVAAAVAALKGAAAPLAVEAGEQAQAVAASLVNGHEKAVLLGLAAAEHPQAADLLALAQWIAEQTGASLGLLGQANAAGLQAVGVQPGAGGQSARAVLAGAPKAVLLLGADPLLDVADPAAARVSLTQAELVVGLASHRSDALLELADVLLPTAPFTETSGSFVNAEGLLQSFVGVVPPLGETRPAWKVLRVLAELLELPGFQFDSSEQVRAKLLPNGLTIHATARQALPAELPQLGGGVQRLAELPLYASDLLVRQAAALQATRQAKQADQAQLGSALWKQLGLPDGGEGLLRVTQGAQHVTVRVRLNEQLADGVLRLAGGIAATSALGASFAEVQLAQGVAQ
ncbi:MAG: molybdopterin-dependent oxidoreductase, partial [Leptothrix sp. (in: Bacteria)]|nr:molybdopterin-dependent oxidoreductase [Leptothrix sp. (in: b-proteobacteria)]